MDKGRSQISFNVDGIARHEFKTRLTPYGKNMTNLFGDVMCMVIEMEEANLQDFLVTLAKYNMKYSERKFKEQQPELALK